MMITHTPDYSRCPIGGGDRELIPADRARKLDWAGVRGVDGLAGQE
jgi:hypothetical protein